MSEAIRIAIIGATGLIGSTVIEQCIGREDVRLTGIARLYVQTWEGSDFELYCTPPSGMVHLWM